MRTDGCVSWHDRAASPLFANARSCTSRRGRWRRGWRCRPSSSCCCSDTSSCRRWTRWLAGWLHPRRRRSGLPAPGCCSGSGALQDPISGKKHSRSGAALSREPQPPWGRREPGRLECRGQRAGLVWRTRRRPSAPSSAPVPRHAAAPDSAVAASLSAVSSSVQDSSVFPPRST